MIVLDTHAWLWFTSSPGALPPPARAAIDASDRIGVPAPAVFEITNLSERGRIDVGRPITDWVRLALGRARVESLEVTTDVALAAGRLPRGEFPGDPIDRLIYATARVYGTTLVTRDGPIRRYDPRGTIWD